VTPSLVLMLHAHLPFIRHPEHEIFYEEQWFFEAITETYAPLLWALQDSLAAGYKPRLTMSLTPPLLSMLNDELLISRYRRHLENLLQLVEKELERTKQESVEEQQLAHFYAERLSRIHRTVFAENDGFITRAFVALQEAGVLEIITCGATHGFLPLMRGRPGAIHAQVEQGARTHERFIGRRPRGIWLPECAFFPGVDKVLADAGIEFFFLDSHGLVNGDPYPLYDVYAPVVTPNGVAAFARDPLSSSLVWSSESGYPGDAYYREFYRDLGWDREFEYIKDHVLPDGNRVNTGLKYRRITGRTDRKEYYDPYLAGLRAKSHAEHFVASRLEHAQRLAARFGDRSPVITAPFDAELFGHWWFEGPIFLAEVFANLARIDHQLTARTAAEVIDSGVALQEVMPSASSWGAGGYNRVWLNPKNQKLQRHYEIIHERMDRLAQDYEGASEDSRRATRQAAREALLAVASDWAFLITKDTAGAFSARQAATHIRDFLKVEAMARSGQIDEVALAEIENRDNIFPAIDPRLWLGKAEALATQSIARAEED